MSQEFSYSSVPELLYQYLFAISEINASAGNLVAFDKDKEPLAGILKLCNERDISTCLKKVVLIRRENTEKWEKVLPIMRNLVKFLISIGSNPYEPISDHIVYKFGKPIKCTLWEYVVSEAPWLREAFLYQSREKLRRLGTTVYLTLSKQKLFTTIPKELARIITTMVLINEVSSNTIELAYDNEITLDQYACRDLLNLEIMYWSDTVNFHTQSRNYIQQILDPASYNNKINSFLEQLEPLLSNYMKYMSYKYRRINCDELNQYIQYRLTLVNVLNYNINRHVDNLIIKFIPNISDLIYTNEINGEFEYHAYDYEEDKIMRDWIYDNCHMIAPYDHKTT